MSNPGGHGMAVEPTDRLAIGILPQLTEMKSADEDWSGISAPAARRKLQNRLNQRARRKRAQKSPDSNRDSHPKERNHEVLNEDKPLLGNIAQSCRLGDDQSRQSLVKVAESALSRYRQGIIDPVHLPDVLRFNVFRALAMNAVSMYLTNDWLNYEAVSSFYIQSSAAETSPAAYPPSLTPTPLQYTVEHHPWVDLLPCPHLRDNFLRIVQKLGEDAIDEDMLCHDVVDAGAGEVQPGAALIVWGNPWEIAGWEVSEAFARRWSHLLHGCDELLESTNYWRAKRGLPRLLSYQMMSRPHEPAMYEAK